MRGRNIIVLFLALALTACQAPAPLPAPATPSVALTAGTDAVLMVDAEPEGAQVSVDGALSGTSPLTLTVAPGVHQVEVAAAGYLTTSETITVAAGEQAIYAPKLTDFVGPTVTITATLTTVPWLGQTQVRATADDAAGIELLELLIGGHLLGEAQGPEVVVDVLPATIPGLAPGGAYTLTARAVDLAGNTGQAALAFNVGPGPVVTPLATTAPVTPTAPVPTAAPPGAAIVTAEPLPQPTAPIESAVEPTVEPTPTEPAETTSIVASTITIPTYPYAQYLAPAVDPNVGNYPFMALNRTAYDNANPRPVPQVYTLLVLENRYLRLSILPDLGGRLWECVFKPTGNEEFYHNPVIKPTHWGPGTPDHPAGANWWLAAGGMEWGFPVEEHGYEWGSKWGYDPITLPDGSAMVTVFTRDSSRPYAVVDIILPPGAAHFTVRPRVNNPLDTPFRFKWWTAAMLAPGPANTVGADLRFIYPTQQMTLHSTGDSSLPKPGEALSWPVYQGRDLSRLGNWNQWLGFFARPEAQARFMAVYDTAADEGMVRVFPETARGAKGFGLGWQSPIDWHEWTDAPGTAYVEMHGGLMPTFDEWYTLGGQKSISWSETWYPAAGIDGLVYAAQDGAINLGRSAGGVQVGVHVTRPVRGQVAISTDGQAPITRAVDLDPARPFSEEFPVTGSPVKVTVTDSAGRLVLSYQGSVPSAE